MGICLDRSAECLRSQTPKEYVQQLASASEALRRARVTERKTGTEAARGLLDELRDRLEPRSN